MLSKASSKTVGKVAKTGSKEASNQASSPKKHTPKTGKTKVYVEDSFTETRPDWRLQRITFQARRIARSTAGSGGDKRPTSQKGSWGEIAAGPLATGSTEEC